MNGKNFRRNAQAARHKRGALVRALMNDPAILFADEPTGSLNSAAGEAVLDLISDVNSGGQSVVMVTHDVKSALRGNRILYSKDGLICGECDLPQYTAKDAARHDKLRSFLVEMGW